MIDESLRKALEIEDRVICDIICRILGQSQNDFCHELAYKIWEWHGKQEGRDLHYWLIAERYYLFGMFESPDVAFEAFKFNCINGEI